MSKDSDINIIIAPISFSTGSAGSMRLRYIVNELRSIPEVELTNFLCSKENNQIDEEFYYDNVKYLRIKYNSWFGTIVDFVKVYNALKSKRIRGQNILYFYGCVKNPIDNYFFAIAKLLGYSIVFDEAELYSTKLREVKCLGFIKIIFIAFNQFLVRYIGDHIFCISHDILEYYKRNSSLLPISYSNEMDIENTNTVFTEKNKNIVIFYSGSYALKDDVDTLIHVCGKLFSQGIHFVLSLCGKVPSGVRKRLDKQIKKYKIESLVVFHGYLDVAEYYHELRMADICVVPRTDSKFANTGFPFKIGEYLAFGKPCVVAETGDINKYLTKDDCFLIKPGKQIQLENAVLQLINNSELRDKYSKNGKLKAKIHFDPKKNVQKILDVFEDI